ncbi:MAG: hypothetical protein K8S94_00445 [Planctomycetia bacterium]|nr:hypothetical protein [Planctomycetia bacterium]
MRPTPKVMLWMMVAGVATVLTANAAVPVDAEIAALITQLGDADFAVRETASTRLAALGAEASDALLAAAESNADLEVALRARWLVESLPLTLADDPPEVAALLDRFTRSDFDDRVQIMHRLLRLDDDTGIEPLARIVRLERTETGSRIAAALLAREWQPDDSAWPGLRDRIAAGLGPSGRPPAQLLRAIIDASLANSPPAAVPAIDVAVATVAALDRPESEAAADMPAAEDPTDASLGRAKTLRIFRRCLVQMLVAAGRRTEAVAEAGRLFAACAGSPSEPELVAAELIWLTDHDLPEAVDLMADRLAVDDADFEPLVGYAAAVAWRRRGDEAKAAALAGRAHARFSDEAADTTGRLQAAMLLARWGADDWSLREYAALIDQPETSVGEFALAGILCAEFLHERQRHAEAAAMLRRVLDGREGEDMDQILMRLERDPRSVRSRMLFFGSRAQAVSGDTVEERRMLEESLRAYGKDVDSLIACYRLSAGSAERRADAKARVARALEQIDEEIQALPDDANGYNEYAWLVANTEGDVRKATRYSKRSLEQSFDTASYLDTLSHCRAAAGDLRGAIRTQLLAVRQEPHNPAIRRNLDQFKKAMTDP